MRALEGLPHISLEAQLCQLQRENHSPHRMTLANALTAFRQELERGSLRAFERPGSPASDGALLMSNIDALGLMDIAFRAADVVRIWPEWPVTRAWNAAKERLWQPQQGIPKGTLKTLPAADYLPFAEVARMGAKSLSALARRKVSYGSRGEELAASISRLQGNRNSCVFSDEPVPCHCRNPDSTSLSLAYECAASGQSQTAS
jgi:hypothetical protein